MYSNQARNAYVGSSVTTAGPARLLVMLVERLVLDLERAQAAQQAGNHSEATTHLVHAQDIVFELEASLKPEMFSAGPQLASIYAFLRSQLVQANVRRDLGTTQWCLGLATALCDTWRTAALQAAH
ncbi:MAG TPA: flagellar export chaperone FliS [Nocardioides sp.]|uniref:flagellar export chaperone FliS n=1 Tax=Nocardioides sp. TaxID=35761 RepID=UPI002ED83A16